MAPGWALADNGRLRQLIRNLVPNAARYGGGHVEILGRSLDDGYQIAVTDDGPGAPPEVEERLFERFVHTGDRPLIVGSVGLGLAICKVLVDGMGAGIAYTRADDSTVFVVTLRSADGAFSAAPATGTEDQVA